MKAELKFEYDPEDADERNRINRMLKVDNCYSALWDIDCYLRTIYKGSANDTEIEVIDTIRTKFYELLEGNHINLEEDWD